MPIEPWRPPCRLRRPSSSGSQASRTDATTPGRPAFDRSPAAPAHATLHASPAGAGAASAATAASPSRRCGLPRCTQPSASQQSALHVWPATFPAPRSGQSLGRAVDQVPRWATLRRHDRLLLLPCGGARPRPHRPPRRPSWSPKSADPPPRLRLRAETPCSPPRLIGSTRASAWSTTWLASPDNSPTTPKPSCGFRSACCHGTSRWWP
mmetsp:Transcript_98838/g.285273  ORF Transcript_98838/g.285273 Transcript_98838/m.285273 type:complete len:209 (-) Transcript_98838:922-1548(-)